MTSSAKLVHSLNLIWSSPIFGDAFPPDSSRQALVLSQIKAVHPAFVNTLRTVLTQGLPLLSLAEIDKLVQQMASRVIPFCTAIAAGEITDMERLRAAAIIIAIVHWADRSMDAGDEVMLIAVPLLKSDMEVERFTTPGISSNLIQARLMALRWIEREVERLSQPEDKATLLACGIEETMQNDYKNRVMSRGYGLRKAEDFWVAHTADLVETLLATAAILHATAAIYAAYRWMQPELPSLPEVFKEQAVMNVLRGPGNAAIRIFDDLSDRLKDNHNDPGGEEFNLNIFNQPEPGFLRAFLDRAGLSDERVIKSVVEAFQASTEDSRVYIRQVFMDLIRNRLAALPTSIWDRYGAFLGLAKRVMESAYVDCYGGLETPISA